MEPGFEDEGPLVTVGAREGIGAGEGAEEFVPGLGGARLRFRVDAEEETHLCDTGASVAVGQDAPGSSPGQAPCRILMKPLGRTCWRKRRMNSSAGRVVRRDLEGSSGSRYRKQTWS